jgi:hypothetical protein
MGETIQAEHHDARHRLILTCVLPPDFRHALDGADTLLVGSREAGRVRAVHTWFVVTPDGELYLFNYAHALRVARWRSDPWVRLTIPGGGPSLEGRVQFVDSGEVDEAVQDLIVDRWGMWGATTPEGLRRMLRDRSHVLVRVDVP